MEEIFKFENRQKLYQFLINNYGFIVTEEKDYDGMGFYVNLISDFFFLRYSNDRGFLSIDIASLDDIQHTYALSFVQDLIYNPESINAGEETEDNVKRINELNNFLQKDFNKICELFNKANYSEVKRKLTEGLDKTFFSKYPSVKKHMK